MGSTEFRLMSQVKWPHRHCHIDGHANKHVNETIDVKCLLLEPVKPLLARVNRLELIASHVLWVNWIVGTGQTCLNPELAFIREFALISQLLQGLLTDLNKVERASDATQYNADTS